MRSEADVPRDFEEDEAIEKGWRGEGQDELSLPIRVKFSVVSVAPIDDIVRGTHRRVSISKVVHENKN